MDQSRSLLALTAAIAADNGDGVARALRTLLVQATPFDRGEIAVARPLGCERWTLTDDEAPLAAEDLVLHLAANREPLRLDDASRIDAFPRTRKLLEAAGQRTLLALPLNVAGGVDGAVLLAERHAWAFAGVSLQRLAPLAGMAGLALERSLALTALERELARARGDTAAPSRSEDAETLMHLAVERDTLAARAAQAAAEITDLNAERQRLVEQVKVLEAEASRLRVQLTASRQRHRRRQQAPLPEPSGPPEPSDN